MTPIAVTAKMAKKSSHIVGVYLYVLSKLFDGNNLYNSHFGAIERVVRLTSTLISFIKSFFCTFLGVEKISLTGIKMLSLLLKVFYSN